MFETIQQMPTLGLVVCAFAIVGFFYAVVHLFTVELHADPFEVLIMAVITGAAFAGLSFILFFFFQLLFALYLG